MDETIGVVCARCESLSPLGAPRCVVCGRMFGQSVEIAAEPVEAGEEEMEQSSFYVCKSCASPVPLGHKFCGSCGAEVPDVVREAQLDYLGPLDAPGNARLILVRSTEGVSGMAYHLNAKQHIAGRTEGEILFPEDTWLSPSHARFVFTDDQLSVRDENSLNGVFLRVNGSRQITPGTHFLCGEQVFRLDAAPGDTAGPEPDQTYFYSSPKRPASFRVTQVIEGGFDGMVFCAREDVARIGREDVDLNFPEDRYMSGAHARVEARDGAFFLVDSDSRNGTYVRISEPTDLNSGSYIFLGRQLLRVEIFA